MGGCSVLVLLGALLAMGAAFLIAFLGALGLFLVAVILLMLVAIFWLASKRGVFSRR